MEPDALFHLCVYQWFRKLAQLSGIDLFCDNYKPSALTYTLISALFVLLASCLWTIWSYEFDEKVICASMLAFNMQGIVKFYSILMNTKEMRYLCDFLLKIYKTNTTSSPNKSCLEKSIKITVFIFKNGMLLLITTAILTSIRPCISYIFIGELDPIIPTHFPGINDLEITGYIILAVFHLYIMFVFVIGTGGADLALMTFVIHSYSMSVIFQNAVTELNRLLKSKEVNTSKSIYASASRMITMSTRNKSFEVANDKHLRDRIHASFQNLILMHYDFIKYTKMLKSIYNEMCLIQITMANIIMIILTYVIIMLDWFPAYFFMATAFFQVFEYSLVGTIVELANDKMYNAICNILATELPRDEQKKVVFIILMAQHPHNLTIGGFEPLNVETFVNVNMNKYKMTLFLTYAYMEILRKICENCQPEAKPTTHRMRKIPV